MLSKFIILYKFTYIYIAIQSNDYIQKPIMYRIDETKYLYDWIRHKLINNLS